MRPINLLSKQAQYKTHLPFALFSFEQTYIHPTCGKSHKISRKVLLTNIKYLFERAPWTGVSRAHERGW